MLFQIMVSMSKIGSSSLTGTLISPLLYFPFSLTPITIKPHYDILYRAHLETAFHKKIAKRLRELRNDTIWVNGEDVSMAFKPMKMGLRVANLIEPWSLFEQKYQRVQSTFKELYRVEFTDEEM